MNPFIELWIWQLMHHEPMLDELELEPLELS